MNMINTGFLLKASMISFHGTIIEYMVPYGLRLVKDQRKRSGENFLQNLC